MGFPTKNDHFGDFWGVKWGYHHVRKHQYMYCQTAKTHGETNPFASKKKPRPAGRSGVAGLHLHRRKGRSGVRSENVVFISPLKKKGEAETQECCPYVVSAILGCF